MFFGEFRHNIDAKGRVSIPAKWRNQCGDLVYVMKGNDGCLDVYNEEQWQIEYKKIAKLSKKKKDKRAYRRLVTVAVNDLPFDKMGRINLSVKLRDMAQLVKECVIIGAGDHMEIWNPDNWDAYYDAYIDRFDELSEEIDDEDDDE